MRGPSLKSRMLVDGSRHARLGHYVQPEKKTPTTMEEPRFLEQTAFIEKNARFGSKI